MKINNLDINITYLAKLDQLNELKNNIKQINKSYNDGNVLIKNIKNELENMNDNIKQYFNDLDKNIYIINFENISETIEKNKANPQIFNNELNSIKNNLELISTKVPEYMIIISEKIIKI